MHERVSLDADDNVHYIRYENVRKENKATRMADLTLMYFYAFLILHSSILMPLIRAARRSGFWFSFTISEIILSLAPSRFESSS